MSITVSNFNRELGISLETLQQEVASFQDDGGTSWFFLGCIRSLELPLGTLGASRVAPGKSSHHSSCEGELGIALDMVQGNLASRHVERGISWSLSSWGRKPWVSSACEGDLRELLIVPIGSQEYCGHGRGV